MRSGKSGREGDTCFSGSLRADFCAKRFFHPWDKKIRCPCVRASVRIIITFCELNLGGGTHAAGPWWFELWILEGRKRTLHLFALATGISRFRDPFLNTVSGTFLQQVSTNIDPPDPP